MSRVITDHIVNPCNDKLTITVTDVSGAGGANHRYEIRGFNTKTNDSDPIKQEPNDHLEILFQNGPINEVGVNGITQEALLAIVADRLRSLQAGPYTCRENALALTKIEEATHWLQQRTIARMRRGVEGTHHKQDVSLIPLHKGEKKAMPIGKLFDKIRIVTKEDLRLIEKHNSLVQTLNTTRVVPTLQGFIYSRVVQLVEQMTVNFKVVGSNPTLGAIPRVNNTGYFYADVVQLDRTSAF